MSLPSPSELALALCGVVVVAHALRGLARRPQRGLLVLVALAPFDGLLLLAPLPSSASYWKQGLLLTVVLASLMPGPGRVRVRPAELSYVLWPVLGLVGLGAASAAAVGGTAGVVGLRVELVYALTLVPLVRTPLTARDRDLLVTVLMVTGVTVALVGLAQQVLGPEQLHSFGYAYNDVIRTSQGRLRSFSTFNQPFPFAFWVMSVLCLTLPVALADRTRWRNRAFLVLTPVLLAGMASAIVRGALLGLAVAGVLLVAHRRYRLGPVLVLPAVVLLLLPPSTYGSLFSPSSLGDRTTSWIDNLRTLLERPFGHGIGSSGSAAEKLAATTPGSRVFQPDNAYYNIMYQLGPLGVWLLVHVVTGAAAAGLRAARRLPDRDDAALALGVGLCAAAVAAASIVSTYFEIFPAEMLFWVSVGVLAQLTGRAVPPEGHTERPATDQRVAAP